MGNRLGVMGKKLVALSGGDGSDVMVSLSNHDRAVDDVALRQAQGFREISLFILPLEEYHACRCGVTPYDSCRIAKSAGNLC